MNGFGKLFGRIRQVGNQFRGTIEADHHGFILAGPNHGVDEIGSSVLLEAEAIANAVAGIDQNADAQRQIGFSGEFHYALRFPGFQDFEFFLVQIRNKAPLLIGNREQHVYARDVERNAGGWIVVRGGWLGRSLSV